MNENQLNHLMQTSLCRFCCHAESMLAPFIHACNCQGPNASIHGHCLEDYLMATKQTKCDICRFSYITKQSDRSLLEWCFKGSSESNLDQLLQLILRFGNIIFMTVFSFAITGLYSDGLMNTSDHILFSMILKPKDNSLLSNNNNGNDNNNYKSTLAWLIMILCTIRIIVILFVIDSYRKIVWNQYLEWRQNNPQIRVDPNPNFRPLNSPVASSTVRVAGLRKLPSKFLNKNVSIVASTTTNSANIVANKITKQIKEMDNSDGI